MGSPWIAGYIGCRDTKEIAKILRRGLFNEVERYANIGDGLDRRII